MSSRLFQNIREKRGLAYAVFSSLSTFRDVGCLSVYAGTASASARVSWPIIRSSRLKSAPPVKRNSSAPDYLKGSCFGPESTAIDVKPARQEMYFGRQFTRTKSATGGCGYQDRRASQARVFQHRQIALTVLGPRLNGATIGAANSSADSLVLPSGAPWRIVWSCQPTPTVIPGLVENSPTQLQCLVGSLTVPPVERPQPPANRLKNGGVCSPS
jgi:hypothetical protein